LRRVNLWSAPDEGEQFGLLIGIVRDRQVGAKYARRTELSGEYLSGGKAR
jgi:hypothetical protein